MHTKAHNPQQRLLLEMVCYTVPSSWNIGKYKYLWRSEDGTGFLGARVIGGGELPEVGAGNQTWVLERAASSLTRKVF